MKQFLTRIVLFFILFFILEKSMCYFINNAPKKEYDKRLEFILNGKINKDIIILGSSRGTNNISAKQLEDSTNQTTYNLSYIGSDLIFQEFIFRTLLNYNRPPKKVILVIDNIFEFRESSSLNFRIDRLIPLKNYNYINNKLIKHKEKNILSKIFCLSRVNREDFKLEKHKIQEGYILTSHGSILIELRNQKEFNFSNNNDIYTTEIESETLLNAFKNIQKLCEKYNIELIYVFPPNFYTFNNSFLKRFKELVQNENNVLIYDTTDVRYKNGEYYYDESHLLKNGATIFTSEIIEFLEKSK